MGVETQTMTQSTRIRPSTNRNARDLRLNPTDAERALWRHLRQRQIAGLKFRRQHPFGGYILDFVCLEARLVIELDGGQHADLRARGPGAHGLARGARISRVALLELGGTWQYRRHPGGDPEGCRRVRRPTPILTFPLPGGRDRKVAAGTTRFLPPPGRGRAGVGVERPRSKAHPVAALPATPPSSPSPGRGRAGVGVETKTMTQSTRIRPSTNRNIRDLRRNLTDAERALWRHLRQRQIAGLKFRRQHPVDRYILDFVCLEARLVIELDGGHHAERQDEDQERTAWPEERGYRVLRFWNTEVLEQSRRRPGGDPARSRRVRRSTPILTFPLPGGRDRKQPPCRPVDASTPPPARGRDKKKPRSGRNGAVDSPRNLGLRQGRNPSFTPTALRPGTVSRSRTPRSASGDRCCTPAP